MKVTLIGEEKVSPIARKLLKTAIKRLKKKCPLNKDLVITIKKHKEGHGFAWTSKGKHRIDLNIMACKTCLVDTLTHEWGHFMAKGKLIHCDEWGIAYAKCYRVVSR